MSSESIDTKNMFQPLDSASPEALRHYLDQCLVRPDTYQIVYQIGRLQALIRIDTREVPCRIWHVDSMGRSDIAIRAVIGQFYQDHYGVERSALLHSYRDISGEEWMRKQSDFLSGTASRVLLQDHDYSIEEMNEKLDAAQSQAESVVVRRPVSEMANSGFGLFKKSPVVESEEQVDEAAKNKSTLHK